MVRLSSCLFLHLLLGRNRMNDQEAFAIAVEEAKLSLREGGVPVIYPTVDNPPRRADRG